MAEIFGTVGTVITIGDLIKKIKEFGNKVKDAPETWNRYCKELDTLDHVRHVFADLIEQIKQINPPGLIDVILPIEIKGKQCDLVQFVSDRLREVIDEAMNLMNAYDQLGEKFKRISLKGLLEWAKKIGKAYRFVLEEDHVRQLLHAVECAKSSLQSVICLVHLKMSKALHQNTDSVYEDLRDHMVRQSEGLDRLSRRPIEIVDSTLKALLREFTQRKYSNLKGKSKMKSIRLGRSKGKGSLTSLKESIDIPTASTTSISSSSHCQLEAEHSESVKERRSSVDSRDAHLIDFHGYDIKEEKGKVFMVKNDDGGENSETHPKMGEDNGGTEDLKAAESEQPPGLQVDVEDSEARIEPVPEQPPELQVDVEVSEERIEPAPDSFSGRYDTSSPDLSDSRTQAPTSRVISRQPSLSNIETAEYESTHRSEPSLSGQDDPASSSEDLEAESMSMSLGSDSDETNQIIRNAFPTYPDFDDNPEAFEILKSLIYEFTRPIPEKVEIDTLFGLLSIKNKYHMEVFPVAYARAWARILTLELKGAFEDLDSTELQRSDNLSEDLNGHGILLADAITLCGVVRMLEMSDEFKEILVIIQRNAWGPLDEIVDANRLLLPKYIIDHVETTRLSFLQEVSESVGSIFESRHEASSESISSILEPRLEESGQLGHLFWLFGSRATPIKRTLNVKAKPSFDFKYLTHESKKRVSEKIDGGAELDSRGVSIRQVDNGISEMIDFSEWEGNISKEWKDTALEIIEQGSPLYSKFPAIAALAAQNQCRSPLLSGLEKDKLRGSVQGLIAEYLDRIDNFKY